MLSGYAANLIKNMKKQKRHPFQDAFTIDFEVS